MLNVPGGVVLPKALNTSCWGLWALCWAEFEGYNKGLEADFDGFFHYLRPPLIIPIFTY